MAFPLRGFYLNDVLVTLHGLPPHLPLQRNQLDTFILTGADVGDMDRIKIRSSGGGLGAAW